VVKFRVNNGDATGYFEIRDRRMQRNSQIARFTQGKDVSSISIRILQKCEVFIKRKAKFLSRMSGVV